MEKKKLLKNKIVDTLPMLYLETVILMVLGQFLGSFILGIPVGIAIVAHPQLQKSAFLNTALMYVIFLGIWAVALFWILIKKRNRPILQAVGTKPQGNNGKYLLFGLGLGFALNGVCILVAWLHHDIALTYDAIHPLWFVVVFLTVFIQSSAEELLCRGFLYQKLRRSYKNPGCCNCRKFAVVCIIAFGKSWGHDSFCPEYFPCGNFVFSHGILYGQSLVRICRTYCVEFHTEHSLWAAKQRNQRTVFGI